MKISICLMLVVLTWQCVNRHSKRKVLVEEGIVAVGDIRTDTTYHGLINFYNDSTGKLLSTAHYINDTLDGESIDYYPNGSIYGKQYFENGKQIGYTYIYDSLGYLTSQHYTYFDIVMGPSIYWRDSIPLSYYFYSFDSKLLMSIEYDQIRGRRIADVVDNQLFFFEIRPGAPVGDSTGKVRNQIFLYYPQPPLFNFEYSIVSVDSNLKITKDFNQLFDRSLPWAALVVIGDLNGLAIQLKVQELDGGESFFLKKLW